jgi:hypothetical protein
MVVESGRRRHENDPLDKLSLLHMRHRCIAALKLLARQAVTMP